MVLYGITVEPNVKTRKFFEYKVSAHRDVNVTFTKNTLCMVVESTGDDREKYRRRRRYRYISLLQRKVDFCFQHSHNFEILIGNCCWLGICVPN